MGGVEPLWAVVPAAGVGRRMGGSVPKQYLPLGGRRVIECTLERLLAVPGMEAVYVALAENDAWWPEGPFAGDDRVRRVAGGEERAHSVLNALRVLERDAGGRGWVLVHDAARPCVRVADVERLIDEVATHPVGGILASPLHDTIKRTGAGECVVRATIPREELWRALTPQMFRIGMLCQALENALMRGQQVTDEASAMELAGRYPLLVEGHADNIKITHPEDLALAAFYLDRQRAAY